MLHTTESVILALDRAKNLQSRLNIQASHPAEPSILEMDGMSSPMVRHLLNNLCAGVPMPRYSEVGTWKGSTLISAMYGNTECLGWCCDNWSLFGGPREEFQSNVQTFIPDARLTVCNDDFFNPKTLPQKQTSVYFYDGCHEERSQYRQLVKASQRFANSCVVIIDDYNRDEVESATREWLADQNEFFVTFSNTLITPEKQNGHKAGWWNGFRILLLEKVERI